MPNQKKYRKNAGVKKDEVGCCEEDGTGVAYQRNLDLNRKHIMI